MKSETSLKRSLKFRDVLILAFSTMIGWGWVSLAGNWVYQGGSIGASLAFVFGAIMCIFVGLAYCELTPMFPYAGGEVFFSYNAMGYNASWFTGWMITFAYIGVAAWEGPALATALDYIVPMPKFVYLYTVAGFDVYLSWLLAPVLVGVLLIYINIKGISFSAKFQAIITLVLAIGGVMFAIVSAIKGDTANITPLVTNSNGVIAVIFAVPAMFVGFDVIPQAAEEMNISLKKIPNAIILSICLAAAWYIMIIISASVSAPNYVLAESGLTVVNAINYATSKVILGKFIIVTAIMGILTSWNGFIIGATRVLYSMGRAGMLPEGFGKVHSENKTPVLANMVVGGISIFTPLLGRNSLSWFVDASSLGTVIAYFMVSISFIILRIKHPNIRRPFRVKYGMFIGVIAVVISLMFICLYLPIGSNSLNNIEWIIVSTWLALGIIFYLMGLKKMQHNKKMCESLMKYKMNDE